MRESVERGWKAVVVNGVRFMWRDVRRGLGDWALGATW